MKIGDKFKQAAQQIFDDESRICCEAIRSVTDGLPYMRERMQKLFNSFFEFDGEDNTLWFGSYYYAENQHHRISALLLCAAYCDEEEWS